MASVTWAVIRVTVGLSAEISWVGIPGSGGGWRVPKSTALASVGIWDEADTASPRTVSGVRVCWPSCSAVGKLRRMPFSCACWVPGSFFHPCRHCQHLVKATLFPVFVVKKCPSFLYGPFWRSSVLISSCRR